MPAAAIAPELHEPPPVLALAEGDRVAVLFRLAHGSGEGRLALPASVARELAEELLAAAAHVERRDRTGGA